eukprot:2582511-Pleurochrysis_carterae.AAC.4
MAVYYKVGRLVSRRSCCVILRWRGGAAARAASAPPRRERRQGRPVQWADAIKPSQAAEQQLERAKASSLRAARRFCRAARPRADVQNAEFRLGS